MKNRPAPIGATSFLKLFLSNTAHESVIGDLLEQYQRGRGSLWYWRQALALVFLRRVSISTGSIPIRQLFALILTGAVLFTLLISDISPILLIAIGGGAITGILKWRLNGFSGLKIEPAVARMDTDAPLSDGPARHPGISMHHIPADGAAGLLFAFGTVFIFGGGIPAIRAILVVTIPLGLVGAGALLYWHRHHPVKIQALGLHGKRQGR